MFGSRRKVASVVVYDPGQDGVVPVLRVPTGETWTIEAAYAVADRTSAASTADYWAVGLYNGGTAGTAVDAVSSANAGGTAGWVANTPKSISITDGSGDLSAGQYLCVNYAETGTAAPGVISVFIEYVEGHGSTATA